MFNLMIVTATLGAGYGDGPKHETPEASETMSKTKVIRNTPPYHKSPVAVTAVLNGFIKLQKEHKQCKTLPNGSTVSTHDAVKILLFWRLIAHHSLITDRWLRYTTCPCSRGGGGGNQCGYT